MFTHKDIEYRTIFVINCMEKRNLRVGSGDLLLEEENGSIKKTLTKMPFQKILALFVIGHITITTALIEKCQRFNVALVVMKPNLRPIFYWSSTAEANYLLRQKQYSFEVGDISIAKELVLNKISNQLSLLDNTRRKDVLTEEAKGVCSTALLSIPSMTDYNRLLGVEGMVSKYFFSAYYQQFGWTSRKPRVKQDALNVTLDIGYTILFNFIEAFVRMFGFDVYIGVYHRLWFKRKSLICDLVEPFRCIIDRAVRSAWNRKQFMESDFEVIKNEYKLKYNKCGDYYRIFFDALVPYKTEIFRYVQSYYRCFMRDHHSESFPKYSIS